MKRIFLAIAAVALLIGWAIISEVLLPRPTDEYIIEGKVYRLLAARTPAEWSQGLMNIRHLDKKEGMIFLFPDKKVRTFWNKNTYLNLEVIWMDGDRVVGRDLLPSIEKSKEVVTVRSPMPVDKVVELVK